MLTKIFPDTINSTVNTPQAYEEAMLYPNPSNGHLELLNNEAVSWLSFYTAQGVLAKVVATSDQDLNLTDLPSGMYIVHLQYRSGKIVKQKIIIH